VVGLVLAVVDSEEETGDSLALDDTVSVAEVGDDDDEDGACSGPSWGTTAGGVGRPAGTTEGLGTADAAPATGPGIRTGSADVAPFTLSTPTSPFPTLAG
jgi:hypothetical protein